MSDLITSSESGDNVVVGRNSLLSTETTPFESEYVAGMLHDLLVAFSSMVENVLVKTAPTGPNGLVSGARGRSITFKTGSIKARRKTDRLPKTSAKVPRVARAHCIAQRLAEVDNFILPPGCQIAYLDGSVVGGKCDRHLVVAYRLELLPGVGTPALIYGASMWRRQHGTDCYVPGRNRGTAVARLLKCPVVLTDLSDWTGPPFEDLIGLPDKLSAAFVHCGNLASKPMQLRDQLYTALREAVMKHGARGPRCPPNVVVIDG